MAKLQEYQEALDILNKQIEATSDNEEKTKLEVTYKETLAKLLERISKLSTDDSEIPANKTSVVSNGTTHYVRTKQERAISNAFENVNTFTGDSVESYIDKITQIYAVMVEECPDKVENELETYFVSQMKLKLDGPVYKALIAAQQDVSTKDNFIQYLRETYGAQINAIQVTSRIFDVSFDIKNKFSVYSAKVNEELQNAFISINKQWQKVHKTQTNIPAEDVIAFFGAVLLTNQIRVNNFSLYKDLIKDLDICLNATQVASRGEYYRDRCSVTTSGSSTFFAKPHKRREKNRDNKSNRENDNNFKIRKAKFQQNERQTEFKHEKTKDQRKTHEQKYGKNPNRLRYAKYRRDIGDGPESENETNESKAADAYPAQIQTLNEPLSVDSDSIFKATDETHFQ